VTRRSDSRILVLRRTVHGMESEGPFVNLPSKGRIRLVLRADRERYSFSWILPKDRNPGRADGEQESALGWGRTAGLCSEGTWRMTFTGVHLGLYCKNGQAKFFSARCVDGSGEGCYPLRKDAI